MTSETQGCRGGIMHLPRVTIPLVACIFLVLAVSSAGFGHAVLIYTTGTVTDPACAAMPNAEIAITDLDCGITDASWTSSELNFTQTHLLAGHYQVKVTAPGFSEFSASTEVQVDATTRADAQLRVGTAETTVIVRAETPLLKTDRADVSNTLTGNEVEQLPMLNRNVTTLVLALPGSQLNGFQHASSENPQGGLQINVNGQYFYSNGFELDGTENHSNILGIAVINPNPDALEEFKVTTGNYDAEFGNVSGALLQGTTKSGTNQIHGSLFEYLRNDKFNAADPFTSLKPPLRWNQFGGSVGGPLRKNKLFGFFDYQGTRRRTGGALITTVPTAAERTGDLSALLGDYICANGTTSPGPCGNPVNVTTTEGAVVPARAGMVFDPTTGNPDGTGRQAISAGGQVNVLPAPNASMMQLLGFLPPPNFGGPGDVANNFASGWTYSLNPTLITDFRFGTYRYRVRVQPGGFGLNPASDAGLIGLNRGTSDTSSMPAFYVTGDGGFNFGYGLNVNQCNCPLSETENHFQWVNNWTKQTGNHTIKWGADIRRAQTTRIDSGNHRSGELTFADSVTGSADVDNSAAGSATTGLGLATYLLGQPSFIARNFTTPGFYPSIRQTRLYFFGQDSWRATSKLSIDYGLRYENYLPQTAAKPGGGGSFDPTTGDVLVAGIGSVPSNFGVKPYNAGFAPRLGLAYRLRLGTAVRAGYGRSFNGAGVCAVFGL